MNTCENIFFSSLASAIDTDLEPWRCMLDKQQNSSTNLREKCVKVEERVCVALTRSGSKDPM